VRRAASLLLAALALAAAGCGGDGGGAGNDEEATDLLERGFATDVDTGVLALDAEVELRGVDRLDGPLRLKLDGPFRAAGSPTEMPDADMDVRASGAGQDFEGRVVLTRENAWIEFRGVTYEVGEELWARALEALEEQDQGGPRSFREAGVDPLDWLDGVETEGDEDVAGVPTTKVTGSLDVEQMLRDFNRLSTDPGAQIPENADEFVGDVDFEAWIGEDGIWRRITAETEFNVPEEERDSVGGLEGGRVSLEVELDEPNEPVEIEGPSEARPIDELLRRLGIPPQLLLGPGFAVPTPG
jgi:hypothetical protein